MPRGTTATKAAEAEAVSKVQNAFGDAASEFNEETWDHFDNGDWDEVGNDNGEIVQFEKGTVMFGIFEGVHSIELPADKQREGQTHADLLIFSYPNKEHGRWSVWKTYQLGEALENVDDPEGKLFRIECSGTRKAAQGEVKVFSVKVKK